MNNPRVYLSTSIFSKSEPRLSDSDIRLSMKKDLPNWIQPFLTQVTAKPYPGQKPWKRTAMNHLVSAVMSSVVGVIISSFGIAHSGQGLVLVPLGWIFTVHGTRKLRLTMAHACAHVAVSGNPKIDFAIGEAISILTMVGNFQKYKQRHVKTHHSKNLLKPGDETYKYLVENLGFPLGMPREKLWKHLWKTIVSPRFYAHQLVARLKSSFLSNSFVHNAVSLTFWSSILALVTFTKTWLIFIVAWAIPMTIFFEISSLLRQCVEHRWPIPATEKRSKQAIHSSHLW